MTWRGWKKHIYRVPVVTTAQLAEMVRMMEVFARYLSNAWKRLEIMSEFQQVRERELALDRRELAEMLLSGQVGNGAAGNLEAMRVLARNVGLERLPDRVLVLRLRKRHGRVGEGGRADGTGLPRNRDAGGRRARQSTDARARGAHDCRPLPKLAQHAGHRGDAGRDVHLHLAEVAHAEPRADAAG